jgi:D-amino-acid dehydrogenase
VKDKLAGAIYGATDGAGDSKMFSQNLGTLIENMGGIIRLNTTIHSLAATGNAIQGVLTDTGVITGDIYILSLGSYSPLISRTVGVKLPIYPVKGHSITAPIPEDGLAPSAGGVDEHLLVGWTRMGDRLRMSSTADFAGYDTDNDPKHYTTIFETAKFLFPRAADYSKAKLHSGLRPMTPDGPPIIGKGKHDNLWYNTGHGHMGWTMACGSSRIVTDLICGREPAIEIEGMGLRS